MLWLNFLNPCDGLHAAKLVSRCRIIAEVSTEFGCSKSEFGSQKSGYFFVSLMVVRPSFKLAYKVSGFKKLTISVHKTLKPQKC